MRLNELETKCLSCNKCGLGCTRTNLVFGTGNENAKIMLVGEGPGEQEDLKGEPFVGKSGQLLDKYLKVIDLDRNKNIYIANIVKCRPPHNRDPRPEEQEQCIKWLREQFKILRPKIIVCLGRMGTFHPSALLRNPDNKEPALKDWLTLRNKISEIELNI